jgi:hypothetical protein
MGREFRLGNRPVASEPGHGAATAAARGEARAIVRSMNV